MLKVKNLTKKFGEKIAVGNIDFEIKEGEIFALIGPNGSGKTTITKCIAGLLRPDSGNILVGEHNIVAEPEEAKSLEGYIPDEPSVWPSITGEEFLYFIGTLYGVPEHEQEAKIPELLSIFNLEGIEGDYFENYSRGNKQKFTVLAALLHNPKLLLIDEPIVGLDPESAKIAQQKLKEYADKGGSVLVVTHTLTVAQNIASRIGVLKEGKLLEVGTMSELRSKAVLGEEATLEDVYSRLTK
ncbi:MAG: hypothetical protein COV29_01775 [Candidatus Yanofskybacteria bacterium CG10_big_fil_rev_8_21_14_0_10_36_16]|uniref:ABC transporter domain-containing protein n=1 Tax=Candidatus Yanofskybacteria bacterium CG10_big_fil_rev_8_21_14_0_10_36_16 TaxID=1975096 RepID=A0A2J0QB18_9BACT|nr:MAG: hypothetical protein COV29_01775 [Candidatus Yanofskybacteria bacterium CG10_big_fil_rev_8_21_14_0_10_36_16]